MVRSRKTAAVALIAVMAASLSVVGGTAWCLRSDLHRRAAEQLLSASLALPSDIGRVVPRTWSSREYHDVRVWLPERRDKVVWCERALVRHTPRPDNPAAYEIEIVGGMAEISARTWLQEDYRGVIESGLRPGFAPGGPNVVRFAQMLVHFERDGFELSLADAAGRVEFVTAERGEAFATAARLNGHSVNEPVALSADFSSQTGGIRVDSLTLALPELPLEVLRLETLLGAAVRTGQFAGRLQYAESAAGRELMISGRCRGLELAECTAGLTPSPWRGRCVEVELQELRLGESGPLRLRFRGALADVRVSDILSGWGLSAGPAVAALEVGAAALSPEGIERFVASGSCAEVSLEALSAALDMGRMSGTLRVRIDDLTIEHNRLKSLDALLTVNDAAGEPNWIEGALLRTLAEKLLHVPLPDILPQRIEYTRLGVRLEVRDEVLYVYGTHGPGEKTILTVRIAGRSLPLLTEPQRPFDLAALGDWLRERAAERLRRELPYSRPAGP